MSAVGGVADLADMQVIEFRIKLGRAETEGPPSTMTLPAALARARDVVHLRRLDVHAADHHDVGPGEIGRAWPARYSRR